MFSRIGITTIAFAILSQNLYVVAQEKANVSGSSPGRNMAELQQLFNERHTDSFLDTAALAERIIKGTDCSKIDCDEIRRQVTLELALAFSFGDELNEPRIRFTSVSERRVGEEHQIVVRASDDSFRFVAYYGCVFGKELEAASGSSRVIDIYDYSVGKLISDRLRLLLFDSIDPARQAEMDEPQTKLNTLYLEMGLLDSFDQLPQFLKDRFDFQQKRLSVAKKKSAEEYGRALDDFRRLYPDALDVSSWATASDPKLAMALLDSVEQRVGPDGYLDFARATLLSQQSQWVEAIKQFRKILPADESYHRVAAEPWLQAALNCPDYGEVLSAVELMVTKLGLDPMAVRYSRDFEGFRASPQYAEWWRRRLGSRAHELEVQAKEFRKGVEELRPIAEAKARDVAALCVLEKAAKEDLTPHWVASVPAWLNLVFSISLVLLLRIYCRVLRRLISEPETLQGVAEAA